jgi:hypothetical protein
MLCACCSHGTVRYASHLEGILGCSKLCQRWPRAVGWGRST